MLNKPIKTKTVAYLVLLPAVLLLIITIASFSILTPMSLEKGIDFVQLIPLLFLSTTTILLSLICIYISIRYFKNKPLKKNEFAGKLFIYFSIGYFLYTSLICLISNLTGNFGGFGPPFIALLLLLILLPLGLGLKNGYQ